MQDRDERLGRVTLTPDEPIVAGRVGQWTLTYTVGSYGIDEGGTIKIARRFASDWQRPQFDDPTAPAYTSVVTDGAASLRARYDPKAHIRPWMKCVVIDVYDGCLSPGDTVTITFGDQSQGSPGIRAQSFLETRHEFRFLVDPTNACLVRRLPSSPIVAVVADEVVSMAVVVPTQMEVGDTEVIPLVAGEDRWGNRTRVPPGTKLAWEGDEGIGIERAALRATSPGRGVVVATWRGIRAESNPVTIHARGSMPRFRKYWGDLHAQSDATVGTNNEWEYFEYGRSRAFMDFMSHQGNDFQMTDEDWARLNEVTSKLNVEGHFVVFPGFEWSANTPAGGDRNVIYREEGMPIMRSSHWQVPDVPEDALTPAHPATELFKRLRERVGLDKVVVAAHCGGRYADIREQFDDELGPLVEVTSCWGVFEWLLWDAFDRGYIVGVMCNSDGHKGRPGAEGPGAGQFGIFGGLTCVLAESLTRDAVFRALKERRCYGTTGPRIDLSFTVDDQPMGSVFFGTGDELRVAAQAHGTAPIERIELYVGKYLIDWAEAAEFERLSRSRRLRLTWGGARIRGRGRRAVWDGTVTVKGATITDARPHSFDSPADGIDGRDEHQVRFRSRTTGDIDGLDLWLDDASSGALVFDTGVGRVEVDLASLAKQGSSAEVTELGGLDLRFEIRRYPETLASRSLRFDGTLNRAKYIDPERPTPVFVKVIQEDGHMAWASPVYVR